MPKGNELYGQASAKVGRFDLVNDPRQGMPILAAGTMNSSTPAFRLGNSGSAYRYGPLVVGGSRNLITNGEVCYSLIHSNGTATGAGRLILGGGTFYDCGLNAAYVTIAAFLQEGSSNAVAVVDGEFAYGGILAGDYPAAEEAFTQAAASTVGVTNGSNLVTGNGTTFTTDALVGGYGGYTPSLPLITPGDLIGIGVGAARNWYRIVLVNAAAGAGALTIAPAYQQATNAAIAYEVIRTGRGSYSRVLGIPDASNDVYYYYVGNYRGGLSYGRIEATQRSLTQHFMAPQSVDAAGTPVADIDAQDIAYYKGFLLYGFGSSVGWSVAGFPTAFPFGATDFPALNITVVDNTDTFVSFEFLGDQLVAIFRRSIWMIQATGTVPEFQFFRMAEPIGALHPALADDQGVGFAYGRPTCSGRAAVYYISRQGMIELSGSTGRSVSVPVDNTDLIRGGVGSEIFILSWEPTTNSVLWRKAGPAAGGIGGTAMMYQVDNAAWTYMTFTNTTGTVCGLTGGPSFRTAIQENFRGFSVAYYVPENNSVNFDDSDFDVAPTAGAAANTGWIWSTPILNLGDFYPGYQFGGFRVDAMGEPNTTHTLSWTVYGGASPYAMVSRDTGTLVYVVGTPSARQLLSGKYDDAFIGIVLTGSRWIELSGVTVAPVDYTARR